MASDTDPPMLLTGAEFGTLLFGDGGLPAVKALLTRLGWHVETSPDGLEERVYRPDGTLAILARKRCAHG